MIKSEVNSHFIFDKFSKNGQHILLNQQQMMQQQMQLQQIQIQQPNGNSIQGQTNGQFVNQSDHQQIQNQLIQHQQIVLQQQNGTNGLQQISIQPKVQQATSVNQSQSIENRPLMSMVSIANGSVTTANGTPVLSSMSLPPHLTLQPPQNPLAAMTTLTYTASPSTILTKEEKQQNINKILGITSATATTEDQQKTNEQLQQTAAATSLMSLSIASSTIPTSSINGPTITSSTPASIPTSNAVVVTSSVSMSSNKDKIPGKNSLNDIKLTLRLLIKNPILILFTELVKTVMANNGTINTSSTVKIVSKPADSPRNEKTITTSSTATIISSSSSAITTTAVNTKPTVTTTTTTTEKDTKSDTTLDPPIINSLNLIRNEKGLLPKAMIKPNVLTHVIEGMVIQEASVPFPVTRKRYSDDSEEPDSKRQKSVSPEKVNDPLSCAHCGKSADSKGKLRKKPFCSTNCAKAAKNALPETPLQNGDHEKIKSEATEKSISSPAASHTSPSPSPSSSIVMNGTCSSVKNGIEQSNVCNGKIKTTSNPNGNSAAETNTETEEQSYLINWSIEEVADYIRSLPGYGDYAEDFLMHEIDGQALLLLNENHLVQTLNIKLGPALKIMSKIDAIKNAPPPMEQ